LAGTWIVRSTVAVSRWTFAITAGGVGFLATGVALKLVLASGAAADGVNAGDNYVGVEAGLDHSAFLGIDGFDLQVTGSFKLNQATDADGVTALSPRMDWTEATTTHDGGGQLVDLEARIRNLRTGEAALLEIAKGAGKISDLLEVQAQITEIRGQIEQLDGQRAQLTDQVAYGTLVTTFGLELVAVQETARGWDPARDVDSATATLIGAGQTFVSAAIWFGIVWLPLILVVLVIVLVARWLIRRFAPRPRHDDPIPGWGAG